MGQGFKDTIFSSAGEIVKDNSVPPQNEVKCESSMIDNVLGILFERVEGSRRLINDLGVVLEGERLQEKQEGRPCSPPRTVGDVVILITESVENINAELTRLNTRLREEVGQFKII